MLEAPTVALQQSEDPAEQQEMDVKGLHHCERFLPKGEANRSLYNSDHSDTPSHPRACLKWPENSMHVNKLQRSSLTKPS